MKYIYTDKYICIKVLFKIGSIIIKNNYFFIYYKK